MSAIETRLAPAPAAPGKAFGGAAGDFPDHLAAGDNFDVVMQATLAPRPQKATGKSPAPAEQNPFAAKFLSANPPAVPVSVKKVEGKTSSDKVEANKKSSTNTEGKVSPGTNAPPVAGVVTEPLPAFLSLPLFVAGSFSEAVNTLPQPAIKTAAPAGKMSGPESISRVTNSSAGKPVSANLPQAERAVPATVSPVQSFPSQPSGGTKEASTTHSRNGIAGTNLPAKLFAPVSAAEAAAIEKTLPNFETPKIPAVTGTAALPQERTNDGPVAGLHLTYASSAAADLSQKIFGSLPATGATVLGKNTPKLEAAKSPATELPAESASEPVLLPLQISQPVATLAGKTFAAVILAEAAVFEKPLLQQEPVKVQKVPTPTGSVKPDQMTVAGGAVAKPDLVPVSQPVATLAGKTFAAVTLAEAAAFEKPPLQQEPVKVQKVPTPAGSVKPDQMTVAGGAVAKPDLVPVSQPATNSADKILPQTTSVEAAVVEKSTPKPDTSKISATDPSAESVDLPAEGSAPLEKTHASNFSAAIYTKETVLNYDAMLSFEKAGTGVAIMPLPMKNQPKTNKVAGPDVKVLPVGDSDQARVKTLPSQSVVSPVRAAENRGTDLNFTFANGNNHAPVTNTTPVLSVLDLPSLTDARIRALDRTHDMMALHAMRLVESKTDTLSVVIKPSVGTELSLELRHHANGIEAQATVLRGDHQFLSQHWQELQQRLDQRGIKLAPLGGETNFTANDNSQFRQQQASQEDVVQQATAFAEFASAGNAGGATARAAVVHDGWESWA